MKVKSNIERRRDAAQATLDRFRDRPFKLGKNDCAKMAAFHLKRLGLEVPLAKAGSYSSPISARAALKRGFGVETLAEWADQRFERIAPSQALVGDLVEFRGSESPIGAFSIHLGGDLVLGYVEEAPDGAVAGKIVYDDSNEPLGAWRTLPL